MNALLIVLTVVVLGALVLRLASGWVVRRHDRQCRLILDLLEQGPACGLALVKKSGGQLGRGTVYIELSHLEEQRLVSSTPEPGGSGRRIYALTDAGRRVQTRLEAIP